MSLFASSHDGLEGQERAWRSATSPPPHPLVSASWSSATALCFRIVDSSSRARPRHRGASAGRSVGAHQAHAGGLTPETRKATMRSPNGACTFQRGKTAVTSGADWSSSLTRLPKNLPAVKTSTIASTRTTSRPCVWKRHMHMNRRSHPSHVHLRTMASSRSDMAGCLGTRARS